MAHATELHDVLDYTPYEGLRMFGRLTHTILRGDIVYRRHSNNSLDKQAATTVELNVVEGAGQWVATGQPDLLGCAWAGEFPSQRDTVLERAGRL